MGNKILVLAPTGIGKTTSLRNLPPAITGIINPDKKELPIKGWRKKYKTTMVTDPRTGKIVTDMNLSNYVEFDKAAQVLGAIKAWGKSPNIENVVLDTITHMITSEYMTGTIGKDFKAYQQLGKSFYDIIDTISTSNKNIIVLGHVEKKITEMGEIAWEMASHGKMISSLVPPSYFTTVLIGEKLKDPADPKKFQYVFRTQSEGNDPAKSPAYITATGEVKSALDFYEPNDIAVILKKLQLFENELDEEEEFTSL